MSKSKQDFISALKRGDRETIDSYFLQDIAWQHRVLNKHGACSIHIAALANQYDIVRYLYDNDFRLIKKRDHYNQTPLHYAVLGGDVRIVKFLSKHGGVNDHVFSNHPSVLYKGKNPRQYALVAEKHDCLSVIDFERFTKIININDPAIIDELIPFAPKQIQIKNECYYLSHVLALKGFLEPLERVLNQYPTLLNTTDHFGQTPLLWAAFAGQTKIVQYLVSKNADLRLATKIPRHFDELQIPAKSALPYKANFHKKTPLEWAKSEGHAECVQILQKACLDSITEKSSRKKYRHSLFFEAIRVGELNVVRQMLDAGYSLDYHQKPKKYHPIHIAAKYDQLTILQLFLAQQPKLIDLGDKKNRTALIWAAIKNYVDIVKYLLDLGADDQIITHSKNQQRRKTAFEWAQHKGHYHLANILLLHRYKKEPNPAIFSLIDSAEQVLDLVATQQHINPIFSQELQDKTFDVLNKNKYSNEHDDYIEVYVRRGKRPSFYGRIQIEKSTFSFFHPVKTLGSGGNGIVRQFASESGEVIAVKSFAENREIKSQNSMNYYINDIYFESQFNTEINPELGLVSLFNFQLQEGNQAYYNYRLVMPHVQGVNVNRFMKNIDNVDELANTMLHVSKKLQEIHNKHIVHGDVQKNNILISGDGTNPKVVFIDFGFSNFNNEEQNCVHHLPLSCRFKQYWFAPERILLEGDPSIVKTNYNQDVYSLGVLFNGILENHPIKKQLLESYSSIQKFLRESLNIAPHKRPKLNLFCSELSRQILFKQRCDNYASKLDSVMNQGARL